MYKECILIVKSSVDPGAGLEGGRGDSGTAREFLHRTYAHSSARACMGETGRGERGERGIEKAILDTRDLTLLLPSKRRCEVDCWRGLEWRNWFVSEGHTVAFEFVELTK